jgi:hypothetical protein
VSIQEARTNSSKTGLFFQMHSSRIGPEPTSQQSSPSRVCLLPAAVNQLLRPAVIRSVWPNVMQVTCPPPSIFTHSFNQIFLGLVHKSQAQNLNAVGEHGARPHSLDNLSRTPSQHCVVAARCLCWTLCGPAGDIQSFTTPIASLLSDSFIPRSVS